MSTSPLIVLFLFGVAAMAWPMMPEVAKRGSLAEEYATRAINECGIAARPFSSMQELFNQGETFIEPLHYSTGDCGKCLPVEGYMYVLVARADGRKSLIEKLIVTGCVVEKTIVKFPKGPVNEEEVDA